MRRAPAGAALAVPFLLAASAALLAQQTVAQSGIGRLVFAEQPERAADSEAEMLGTDTAASFGIACAAMELYRWPIEPDSPEHARRIIAAGEKALRDRGYQIATLPVELDTVVAHRARLANRRAADADVLAVWQAGEDSVDLALCRVK